MAKQAAFDQRMQELADHVGGGKVIGRIRFDQSYAEEQHEDMALRHPGGGEAKFLYNALQTVGRRFPARIAAELYDTIPRNTMLEVSREVGEDAQRRAPIWTGDLRASMAIDILDAGAIVYRQPPVRKRLTAKELEEKSKRRDWKKR